MEEVQQDLQVDLLEEDQLLPHEEQPLVEQLLLVKLLQVGPLPDQDQLPQDQELHLQEESQQVDLLPQEDQLVREKHLQEEVLNKLILQKVSKLRLAFYFNVSIILKNCSLRNISPGMLCPFTS